MKWPRGLATFVLIVVAAVLTWQPTWDESYAEDDYLFLDAALDRTPRSVLAYLTGEGVMDHHVRPLSDPLFFFALHAIDGTNPRAYHLALLVLHTASALLLASLVWRLGLGRAAGTIAAVLYVTRDFSYPSLVWASGISDIGSGFFVLSSLVCLTRFAAGGPAIWRVASVLALAGALLTKETSIVALGLALLVTLAITAQPPSSRGSRLRTLARVLWPFVLVSLPITMTQLARADFESAGRELYELELSGHAFTTWPAFLVWSIAGAKELVAGRTGQGVVTALGYAALGMALAALIVRRERRPAAPLLDLSRWRGVLVFVASWFFLSMFPALLAPKRVLTNYLVLGGAGIALGLGVALARLGDWTGAKAAVGEAPSAPRRIASIGIVFGLVAMSLVLVRWKDQEKLVSGGWVDIGKARALDRMVRELAGRALPTPEPGSNVLVFGALRYDVRVLGDPRREGFAPRQVLPSALRVAYGRTDVDALSLPPIANTPPDLLRFVADLAASEVVHVVRAEGPLVDVTDTVRRLAARGATTEELRRVVAAAGANSR